MKSFRTREFRKLLRELPPDIREQAYAAYRQFKRDPFHNSLHFKLVNPKTGLYSARINRGYRALGYLEDDTLIWFWIGTHGEYDKRLSR